MPSNTMEHRRRDDDDEEDERLTPELQAAGYSKIHPTPIDLLDRPENIERYLRVQMETHLKGRDWDDGGHPGED